MAGSSSLVWAVIKDAERAVSSHGGRHYRKNLHDIKPVGKGPYNEELAKVASTAAEIIRNYFSSYTGSFSSHTIPAENDLLSLCDLLESVCLLREDSSGNSGSVKIQDDGTIINVYCLLGQLYHRRGRANAAQSAYEHALGNWKSTWPAHSPERLGALTNYMKFLSPLEAGQLRTKELLEIATRHWNVALEIICLVGTDELLLQPDYVKYLGLTLRSLGSMVNAIVFAEMSIGRLDEAHKILSQSHPLFGEANNYQMPLDIEVENWFLHAQVCEDPLSTADLYRDAWVQSALCLGPWSFQTLAILEKFSFYLLSYDIEQNRVKSRLLSELCLASYYVPAYGFGTDKAFKLLAETWPDSPVLSHLGRVHDDDLKRSADRIRFEFTRNTASTVVELFGYTHASMANYAALEATIVSLLKGYGYVPALKSRLQREMAMCRYMQNFSYDLPSITNILSRESDYNLRLVHRVDQAILVLRNHGNPRLSSFPGSVFFLEDFQDSMWSGFNADIRARLSGWGLSHFNLHGEDLPFVHEKVIGHGSFASVDLVSLHRRRFARKVTMAARGNRNAIRQSILREVEVMRLLHHPHIVSVYCSYEMEQQFAIILEPVADCNLEEYLDHVKLSDVRLSDINRLDHVRLFDIDQPLASWQSIQQWMLCLARTLDHIHQKNVRHKDIKSRNILVQNDRILFADFGSSRAFPIESSTTEGPSVGHTRMYSAPEVISGEKRNKSADVFSLGCVFTEMLTVMSGRSTSQYREYRRIKTLDHPQHGYSHYYATLDRVEDWFTNMDAYTKPGLRIIRKTQRLYNEIVKQMLDQQPQNRPMALQIAEQLRPAHVDADDCPYCRKYSPPTLSGLDVMDLLGLLPQSRSFQ